MKNFIIAEISALLTMLLVDAVWLKLMAKQFYSRYIGHLMLESPNLTPAIFFYLIYTVALVILVVLPSKAQNISLGKTFILGALLGLAAYATYDLTNQATLKNWPTIVTLVDLAWGALLTGLVAVVSAYFIKIFS